LQNAFGRKEEGDAALAGGWWQRETDRHQGRVVCLGAASNDHRPSPICPAFHQRQFGQ
jgi:hypothetical protein